MAGDWIPIRTDLHGVPEVLRLARLIGRSVDEVVGLLVRFWSWFQSHTEDGFLGGLEPEDAGWGANVPQEFITGLIEVGWLRRIDGEGLEVPNFSRWMSGSAKSRLRERDKKKLQREDRNSQASPTDVPILSRICPQNVPPASGQKRDTCPDSVPDLSRVCPENVPAKSGQNRDYRTEQKRIFIINDDDDVERGGAGGENQPPPVPVQAGQNRDNRPRNVPAEAGQNRDTGPPPAVGPDSAKVERAFRACERLWPGGRIAKRRDRLLVWRLAVLAAGGEAWARIILESLWDAKPAKPGAYLQRLILELGPREPENVAIILEKIPVPPEIVTPINGRAPPAQGAKAAAGTPDPEGEKPLSPEEGRAMIQELMAVVRGNGKV